MDAGKPKAKTTKKGLKKYLQEGTLSMVTLHGTDLKTYHLYYF